MHERPLQVPNRLELHGPESALPEFRKPAELPSQLLGFQALEPKQLFGTVKREQLSAPRFGVEPVGELGHLPGGFVGEWKWASPSGDPLMQSVGVLLGLEDDALQRVTRGLGLDDPDRAPVGVQEIVGEPTPGFSALFPLERVLPDGYAEARVDVQVAVVLDVPARGGDLEVDLLAGAFFGGEGHLVDCGWRKAGRKALSEPLLPVRRHTSVALRESPHGTGRAEPPSTVTAMGSSRSCVGAAERVACWRRSLEG